MHDLKNELKETCSANRNRKADVIALQTELNSANENIVNMTRMIQDLKNLQIQDQRSTDGLSASTEIISHVSQEIAINNGLDPTGFEYRLDGDSDLNHTGFYFLCSLLMPYWTGFCVFRMTCRQDYETLFHVVILSKHHHHYSHPERCYSRESGAINQREGY
jgi:hypothetical protein